MVAQTCRRPSGQIGMRNKANLRCDRWMSRLRRVCLSSPKNAVGTGLSRVAPPTAGPPCSRLALVVSVLPGSTLFQHDGGPTCSEVEGKPQMGRTTTVLCRLRDVAHHRSSARKQSVDCAASLCCPGAHRNSAAVPVQRRRDGNDGSGSADTGWLE
jgi:hypothetical protein